ncbi:MAG: thioredoxin domain-containing protein [Thermoleophilaceae bacterium]|nr:thioredoxin domain-containing protein [Thermoleophilaceae bacterium]
MSSRKEQKEQAKLEREAKEKEHAAKAARTRRMSIIGGVLGLALIGVVVAVVVSTAGTKSESNSEDAKEVNALFAGIPQTFDTLGEPGAKATIIEYADLKCPFCADWSRDSLPIVVEEAVRTGKAKLIFRPLTLIDENTGLVDSINAAKYAGASGLQNKMFPFVDLFYLNQKAESDTYATEEFLESIGAQVDGLNTTEAADNRENPKVTALIQDAEAAATNAGVSGTPSFFVGSSEEDADQESNKIDVSDLSDPQPILDAVDALQ